MTAGQTNPYPMMPKKLQNMSCNGIKKFIWYTTLYTPEDQAEKTRKLEIHKYNAYEFPASRLCKFYRKNHQYFEYTVT